MGALFADDFHDRFGTWPLGYIPAGGADFGEVQAVARAVGTGGDDAFYAAFVAAADRLAEEGAQALARGHRSSASDLLLRASVFYGASFHPIYGAPVDPRLLAAYRKQIAVFDRGLELLDAPATPLRIPLGAASMPAYFLPAFGRAGETRPLLVLVNGYDGTVTDLYFASAVAAARRGYHCLIFDGPGQGGMLYEQGVPLRPDWETVVAAVLDVAVTLPGVDQKRIALAGWSLGGYLAARAATAERRIAALIVDPGLWGIAQGFRAYAIKLGATPEAAARLGQLDEATLARFDKVIAGDRALRWSIVQRGFWVHGVGTLRDYLRSVETFTLDGLVDRIACPTLVTMAEHDSLSAGAPSFYEALRCPKTLVRFTEAEGAGEHCEMMNRSLVNRRALDWLDERFGV